MSKKTRNAPPSLTKAQIANLLVASVAGGADAAFVGRGIVDSCSPTTVLEAVALAHMAGEITQAQAEAILSGSFENPPQALANRCAALRSI